MLRGFSHQYDRREASSCATNPLGLRGPPSMSNREDCLPSLIRFCSRRKPHWCETHNKKSEDEDEELRVCANEANSSCCRRSPKTLRTKRAQESSQELGMPSDIQCVPGTRVARASKVKTGKGSEPRWLQIRRFIDMISSIILFFFFAWQVVPKGETVSG